MTSHCLHPPTSSLSHFHSLLSHTRNLPFHASVFQFVHMEETLVGEIVAFLHEEQNDDSSAIYSSTNRIKSLPPSCSFLIPQCLYLRCILYLRSKCSPENGLFQVLEMTEKFLLLISGVVHRDAKEDSSQQRHGDSERNWHHGDSLELLSLVELFLSREQAMQYEWDSRCADVSSTTPLRFHIYDALLHHTELHMAIVELMVELGMQWMHTGNKHVTEVSRQAWLSCIKTCGKFLKFNLETHWMRGCERLFIFDWRIRDSVLTRIDRIYRKCDFFQKWMNGSLIGALFVLRAECERHGEHNLLKPHVTWEVGDVAENDRILTGPSNDPTIEIPPAFIFDLLHRCELGQVSEDLYENLCEGVKMTPEFIPSPKLSEEHQVNRLNDSMQNIDQIPAVNRNRFVNTAKAQKHTDKTSPPHHFTHVSLHTFLTLYILAKIEMHHTRQLFGNARMRWEQLVFFLLKCNPDCSSFTSVHPSMVARVLKMHAMWHLVECKLYEGFFDECRKPVQYLALKMEDGLFLQLIKVHREWISLPTHTHLRFIIGIIDLETGKVDEARGMFQEVHDEMDGNVQSGIVRYEGAERAENTLGSTTNASASPLPFYRKYASILFKTKEYRKLIELCTSVLRHQQDHQLYLFKAHALLCLDTLRENHIRILSAWIFSESFQRFEPHWQFYHLQLRGIIAHNVERNPDAAHYFWFAARSIKPWDYAVNFNMCLLYLGRHDKRLFAVVMWLSLRGYSVDMSEEELTECLKRLHSQHRYTGDWSRKARCFGHEFSVQDLEKFDLEMLQLLNELRRGNKEIQKGK
uniref:Uncharacterized protein n=1 Tax=Percolomonas cosmopolitus TaxID=63605 RepID=A0A7S1KNE2_9EUKA|mmetsp:Transcript_278/g.961  ORF Transcript_278/g.961 Transcript_278/m.961 type:complete len:804 (+) Transcript_278:1-2412(+)